MLTAATGHDHEIEEGPDLFASYQAWFDWAAQRRPAEARSFAAQTPDAAAWRKRLAAVEWNSGDAERGQRVFQKQACHRCHVGNSRLGPELTSAARRFSRDDLFAAIIDPNQNVSPLYQTMQIETGSGRVYYGLLIYESPDGTLLQTTPDQTIRIAGDEIVALRPSKRSLMPAGLLNGLSDQDLADLYAYLQKLEPSRQ